MKKLHVMTVFGTRPEAIKMAPLIKELEKGIEKTINEIIKEGKLENIASDDTNKFMLARKNQLEKRWENLNNAYLSGAYTLEYFLKMDKQIKQEISEIDIAPHKAFDYENAWQRYSAAVTPTEKRNILKEFIDSIRITPEKFFIDWH